MLAIFTVAQLGVAVCPCSSAGEKLAKNIVAGMNPARISPKIPPANLTAALNIKTFIYAGAARKFI
jgi:hypothetical protein